MSTPQDAYCGVYISHARRSSTSFKLGPGESLEFSTFELAKRPAGLGC